jgi:hypothetical protein
VGDFHGWKHLEPGRENDLNRADRRKTGEHFFEKNEPTNEANETPANPP